MSRCFLVLAALSSFAILGALLAVSRINISAVPEPGETESYLAVKAKHFLVRRSSRHVVQPTISSVRASASDGDKLFGLECAACHGLNGVTPTESGRWMYPRAASLVSAEVQQYSDAELFWIVKNGIRLSGMPAFGQVETDANIWNLVYYVRTLPDTCERANTAK